MSFLGNSRFLKRIRLYMVGFFLGILLVLFIFPKRCGFPDPPTTEEVRSSFRRDSLLMGSDVAERVDSIGMDRTAFKEHLGKGRFILPKRKDLHGKRFRIETEDPAMKAFLEVQKEGGTRVDSLQFHP